MCASVCLASVWLYGLSLSDMGPLIAAYAGQPKDEEGAEEGRVKEAKS